MTKIYTSYLIKTSDKTQVVIDDRYMQELEMQSIEEQLKQIISFDEPSDEVLGELFAKLGIYDAM